MPSLGPRLGLGLALALALAACAAPPTAPTDEDGGTASISAPGKGGVGGDGNPRKPAPSPRPSPSRAPGNFPPGAGTASTAPGPGAGPLTSVGSAAPSSAPGTAPASPGAGAVVGGASPAASADPGGFASAAPSDPATVAPSFPPSPTAPPSVTPPVTAGEITTLAGSLYGEADGVGEAATFSHPADLATDGQGRLYVADTGSGRVRRVEADGTVTTLVDAAAAPHVVDALQAIAVGPLGQVSVAVAASGDNRFDRLAHQAARSKLGAYSQFAATQIRAVAHGPDGRVYFALPLVGECPIWSIGPSGDAAELRDAGGTGVGLPSAGDNKAMAIAPDGTIYVLKAARIFRARPGEQMRDFAGGVADAYSDGMGGSARFNNPADLALMPDGSLVVADTFNQRIRHVTKDGLVSTVAGDGEVGFVGGPALQARFQVPRGIAVGPDNTVYVADTFNHRIRKFKLQ